MQPQNPELFPLWSQRLSQTPEKLDGVEIV